MSKYRIGVTEAGDAGIDLSWEDKLCCVDGAVLITKHITPKFCEAALRNKGKVIIHATVTGYGGSIIEPCVPSLEDERNAIVNLVNSGFQQDYIVIRVDPIIPTKKGVNIAQNTILSFVDLGFTRFRISILDMYPHVRERFTRAGLPLPYGENGFSPNVHQVAMVDDMVRYIQTCFEVRRQANKLSVESCAEPGLRYTVRCGCVSEYDLRLLGLDDRSDEFPGIQRKNCLCYSGKTELLDHKKQCQHRCLYCYWR